MNVLCTKMELNEAISVCQKAVSVRSTKAILEGILFEADEDLRLTGYDTQIGIESRCMADVREKGRILINAKLIGDVVRKLPDGMVHLKMEKEGSVEVSCGRTSFRLKALDADGYPKLPDIDADQAEKLVLPQKTLKEMISKTIFTVSTDSARPNLNGALLSCTPKYAEMVAIDGFRLSVYGVEKEDEESEDWPTVKFIIHGKTLKELSSILREKENITIHATENHILFDAGDFRLISGLIQGEFMDHKKILPSGMQSVIVVDKRELQDAFERAFLMVSLEDNRFPVTLKTNDEETMHMSINTVRGSFEEDIAIQLEGEMIDCDFNPRFYMEALRVIEDEKINIKFNGNVGPSLITPVDNEHYAYLILPLRKF